MIALNVFEILKEAGGPLGAHKIAAVSERRGKPLTPAQAYRTIRRFIRAGLVLRIESRNAFMLRTRRSPMLLLCEICRNVSEVEDDGAADLLFCLADRQAFRPDGLVLEIRGRCRDCNAGDSTEA